MRKIRADGTIIVDLTWGSSSLGGGGGGGTQITTMYIPTPHEAVKGIQTWGEWDEQKRREKEEAQAAESGDAHALFNFYSIPI